MLSRRWALPLFIILVAAQPAAAQDAADPKAVWAALSQPSFDPQKVATVSNLAIERDLARLTFVSGTLGFAQPVNNRVLQAAFRGRGVFSIAPELPMERQQLQFHTGQTALEVEFTEAIFFFSDSFFEDVSKQAPLGAGDSAGVQSVFAGRYKTLLDFGLDERSRLLRAALSENPAPLAFFHAELKTDKYGWLLLEYDRADLEEVSLARWDSGYRTIDTWCRFPAGGRTPVEVFQNPNARDAFTIRRYKLDVQVDKDTTLTGRADVNLTVRVPGQRVLLFGLTSNLQVSSVSDAGGAALTFFQPPDPKDKLFFDDTVAVVLPAATTEGQELTLRFAYAGKRVVRNEGAGVYFARSFEWYPFGGGQEFTHRYDFDLTLRVPKKYDAVAIGNKIDEDRVEGEYKVTHWVTDLPTAVCGFAFGSYYIEESKLEDGTVVQGYVNQNPDQFIQGIQTQNEQASDTVMASGADVEGPRGMAASSRTGSSANNARDAIIQGLQPARLGRTVTTEVGNSLKVFKEYFGPYPYKKLAVSNIPLNYGYGQGWPSLLYVSSQTFLDSTQRHELSRGRINQAQEINLTDRFRAHETSHQWWGHAVGWKSYHDQWLSEGFAEFSAYLYTHVKRGKNDYLEALRADRQDLLSKDREGAVLEQIGPIYAGFRLRSVKHPGTYQPVVYYKGGWVLHMLRMMLYDFRAADSDARFKQMMHDFTKTYWNQAASTDDFRRIAEKYMTQAMDVDGNQKLDWFFNEWVYNIGIPHYTLNYTITPQGSGVLLKGTIKQSGVPDDFVMPVPIYAYSGTNVVRLGWLTVRGPETPFDISLPQPINKISINEWEDVLCYVDYNKQS